MKMIPMKLWLAGLCCLSLGCTSQDSESSDSKSTTNKKSQKLSDGNNTDPYRIDFVWDDTEGPRPFAYVKKGDVYTMQAAVIGSDLLITSEEMVLVDNKETYRFDLDGVVYILSVSQGKARLSRQ